MPKKCKLFPTQRKDVVSIQEVKQKAGWEITAFDLPEVWKYTQGDNVTIAVLDTGCQLSHQDLVGNLVPGFNLINKSKPPEDDQHHGTHVTGIICAKNNNIGVVGVAPKSHVMPVKILDIIWSIMMIFIMSC